MDVKIQKKVCLRCPHFSLSIAVAYKQKLGKESSKLLGENIWGCSFHCKDKSHLPKDWIVRGVVKNSTDRFPPWCPMALEHLLYDEEEDDIREGLPGMRPLS